MNTKYAKLYYTSSLSFIICFFSFLVFLISMIDPPDLLYIVNSLILCIFSFLIFLISFISLQKKYDEVYKIFLTGDEKQISKIDKATLIEVLKQRAKVPEYSYVSKKVKHPTFQEYRDIKVFAFPIAIELNFKLIDNELKKENFQLNREVVYSTGSKKLESLIIDDVNKRFAVINGKIIDIVPFTDLKSCEIYNSSNAIQTSAKPMSYRTQVHTSVTITLKNNLQKPNITINFIDLHKTLFPNAAYDIKGALDYILEQNNNIQS